MNAEIGPQEALRRRALLLGIRDGEDPEGAVRQEDQLAAVAQEARGLRGSAGADRPRSMPILADGEAEACIGHSARLGIAVGEREVEVVLILERARRAELLGRVVDVGWPSPAPHQPGRYVRRPAAELDDELATSSGRALSSVSGTPRMPQVLEGFGLASLQKLTAPPLTL